MLRASVGVCKRGRDPCFDVVRSLRGGKARSPRWCVPLAERATTRATFGTRGPMIWGAGTGHLGIFGGHTGAKDRSGSPGTGGADPKYPKAVTSHRTPHKPARPNL